MQDESNPYVVLHNKVWDQGYPNIYGAQIPIASNWNLSYLGMALHQHADKEVVSFLKYGWPANRLPTVPPPSVNMCNHKSATDHPEYIWQYIFKELQSGHIVGPFNSIPFIGRVGVSPLSTREKKSSTHRRTILDLSFPGGSSVNDHTSKDDYMGHVITLKYPTVDMLACRIYELGTKCRLYKTNLLSAFKQLGLDPPDIDLFGFVWEDLIFFYRVLVMGH